MYTYLLVNFFTILIPFAYSFDKRIRFVKKWKFFFPAMAITGAFFIIWDVSFTTWGVWGFNDRYLSGLNVINLPIEEWLFFLTIPYACVFTYEALKVLLVKDYLQKHAQWISLALILFLVVVAFLNIDKAYTATTFLLLAILISILLFALRVSYLGRFYLSYAILLLPFFVVNGVLTGSWIEEQVVWYNDSETLGIRLGTIPIEDVFYGMLLILMNVSIFEHLQARFSEHRR